MGFFTGTRFAVTHRFALGETLLFGHLFGYFQRAQFLLATFFRTTTRFFSTAFGGILFLDGLGVTAGFAASFAVFQAEFFVAAGFFCRHVFGQGNFLCGAEFIPSVLYVNTRFGKLCHQAIHRYFQLFGYFCDCCHCFCSSCLSTKPWFARFEYER